MRVARSVIVKLFALIAVASIVAGCGSGGFIISKPVHVRTFNALVDGGQVTVTIGDDTLAAGLPFEGMTGYVDVDAGSQEIKVNVGASTIVDNVQLLIDNTKYTYLIYGTSAGPQAQFLADTAVTPNGGESALIVANAAFGSNGFDVYVTTPGASLDNMSPNFSNVPYTTVTGTATLASGTYQIRATLPNSKQVIYDGGTVTLQERTVYYVVLYTRGSTTLLNGALLAQDSAGTGSIVNSRLAQFKVAHAAPDTPPVNALVDGTPAFFSIPYQNTTSYQPLSAGTHTITFEAVTSPGAAIASTQPTFQPATDSSVFVTGLAGSQTAVVLSDNNLSGSAGTARLRFVNAATNVGPVDVLINFARRVTALGTNQASAYSELVEDAYTIDFVTPGTSTSLLTMSGVSLTAARTYTLYLMGTPGHLVGVLSRDD